MLKCNFHIVCFWDNWDTVSIWNSIKTIQSVFLSQHIHCPQLPNYKQCYSFSRINIPKGSHKQWSVWLCHTSCYTYLFFSWLHWRARRKTEYSRSWQKIHKYNTFHQNSCRTHRPWVVSWRILNFSPTRYSSIDSVFSSMSVWFSTHRNPSQMWLCKSLKRARCQL